MAKIRAGLSSGGGSQHNVYEDDITLDRSNDTPIDLGWEPKLIFMWDNTNATSYPVMYGYCKDADFMGSYNAILAYYQSGTIQAGTLGGGNFQDDARGSIKSVSATGCVINKVSSTYYGLNRHIVIVG